MDRCRAARIGSRRFCSTGWLGKAALASMGRRRRDVRAEYLVFCFLHARLLTASNENRQWNRREPRDIDGEAERVDERGRESINFFAELKQCLQGWSQLRSGE